MNIIINRKKEKKSNYFYGCSDMWFWKNEALWLGQRSTMLAAGRAASPGLSVKAGPCHAVGDKDHCALHRPTMKTPAGGGVGFKGIVRECTCEQMNDIHNSILIIVSHLFKR